MYTKRQQFTSQSTGCIQNRPQNVYQRITCLLAINMTQVRKPATCLLAINMTQVRKPATCLLAINMTQVRKPAATNTQMTENGNINLCSSWNKWTT